MGCCDAFLLILRAITWMQLTARKDILAKNTALMSWFWVKLDCCLPDTWTTPHKSYGYMSSFSSVVSLCWSIWPQQASTGWNSFPPRNSRMVMQIEKHHRVSMDIRLRSKWVKFQSWVNEPFKMLFSSVCVEEVRIFQHFSYHSGLCHVCRGFGASHLLPNTPKKGAFSASFPSAAFAVAALCNRQLWECKVCIGFLAPTAANPTLVAQGF